MEINIIFRVDARGWFLNKTHRYSGNYSLAECNSTLIENAVLSSSFSFEISILHIITVICICAVLTSVVPCNMNTY